MEKGPDIFITAYPPPTPREMEVLEIILEECAEVQHRICKAMRFGMEESQKDQQFTNRQRIAIEVGDLYGILHVAIKEHILSADIMQVQKITKSKKLEKYMQTTTEYDGSRG